MGTDGALLLERYFFNTIGYADVIGGGSTFWIAQMCYYKGMLCIGIIGFAITYDEFVVVSKGGKESLLLFMCRARCWCIYNFCWFQVALALIWKTAGGSY